MKHGVKWHLRVPLSELANPPFCYKFLLDIVTGHYVHVKSRSLHQAPVVQWLSRATEPAQTEAETAISLFSFARCVLLLPYVCMLHAQSGSLVFILRFYFWYKCTIPRGYSFNESFNQHKALNFSLWKLKFCFVLALYSVALCSVACQQRCSSHLKTTQWVVVALS